MMFSLKPTSTGSLIPGGKECKEREIPIISIFIISVLTEFIG